MEHIKMPTEFLNLKILKFIKDKRERRKPIPAFNDLKDLFEENYDKFK